MTRLYNYSIKRFVFIVLLAMIFVGCNSKPTSVLNERDMVNILTDLHKLDGSLMAKGWMYDASDKKNEYYIAALTKYGITQAEFDSSLVWYSKNPKRFNQIYDQVIVNLTNLQTDVTKSVYHPIDSVELAKTKLEIWPQLSRFYFTKDSVRKAINFNVANDGFMLGDVYILKFLQKITPKDSIKKYIQFQINYVDGSIHGVKKTIYNDTLLRRYTIQIRANRAVKIKSISGQLIGSKDYKRRLNILVDSISLKRIYIADDHDSLLKVLQKADPKHYPTKKVKMKKVIKTAIKK